jgi:HD-GYP domain-containing protein (c-di-GMP phosphodiesterase class II)
MVADVSPLSMGAQTQFQQIADIANMTPADYAAMTRENYNPYQTDVIDASVARAAREREISRVGEQAELAKRGAFGNERRGVYEAERQVGYELGRDEMIANLMQQGYSQAQAQTMAQLGTRQSAAGQAAAGMMQLGNLEQLTQQAGLDAQMQEFMRQQNMPLQQLGALVSAAGGVPAGYGSTTESRKTGLH